MNVLNDSLMWDCYNAQFDESALTRILQKHGYARGIAEKLAEEICHGFHPSPFCNSSDNGDFKTPHTIRQLLDAGIRKLELVK